MDAWGTLNEALAQLRATHGRLPELDTIERSAACLAGSNRRMASTLRIVGDAVSICSAAETGALVEADQ